MAIFHKLFFLCKEETFRLKECLLWVQGVCVGVADVLYLFLYIYLLRLAAAHDHVKWVRQGGVMVGKGRRDPGQ